MQHSHKVKDERNNPDLWQVKSIKPIKSLKEVESMQEIKNLEEVRCYPEAGWHKVGDPGIRDPR